MKHQFVHCDNRKWPQGGTTFPCPTQVSGETRALGVRALGGPCAWSICQHRPQRLVSHSSSCFTLDPQILRKPWETAALHSCPLEVRGLEAKGLQVSLCRPYESLKCFSPRSCGVSWVLLAETSIQGRPPGSPIEAQSGNEALAGQGWNIYANTLQQPELRWVWPGDQGC